MVRMDSLRRTVCISVRVMAWLAIAIVIIHVS